MLNSKDKQKYLDPKDPLPIRNLKEIILLLWETQGLNTKSAKAILEGMETYRENREEVHLFIAGLAG